jgi:transposase
LDARGNFSAMAQIKSWTVSDELWQKIEGLVPPPPPRPANKTFKRKPGAGRKPMADRRVFEAIVFVLRTGIQWKALPKDYGSSSAVHARFQYWADAGFFLRIWQAGLAEYDGMEGIAWEWQSVDGALGKAPLATECSGRNPTDRGKKGAQAQLAHGREWHPAVTRRSRSKRA